MNKIAIYARVSTDRQEVENQLLQLRQFIKSEYGVDDPQVYKDEDVSGRKTILWQRPKGEQLLNDIKSRKIELLVVWAVDRLTREGIDSTRDYLNLLRAHNVKVVSFTERFLNTDNDLIRNILIDVLAWVAKNEALQISQRTKAGLERARKQGKSLGRKKTYTDAQLQEMRTLRQGGASFRKIGKLLGVNPGSVKYALKRLTNVSESSEVKT